MKFYFHHRLARIYLTFYSLRNCSWSASSIVNLSDKLLHGLKCVIVFFKFDTPAAIFLIIDYCLVTFRFYFVQHLESLIVPKPLETDAEVII